MQLPIAAPLDVNDNMRSPSASACPRLLAVLPPPNKYIPIACPKLSVILFDNYTYLSSSLSTSACPRISAALAVLIKEAASIQIQLLTAALPVSKRLRKSVVFCIE